MLTAIAALIVITALGIAALSIVENSKIKGKLGPTLVVVFFALIVLFSVVANSPENLKEQSNLSEEHLNTPEKLKEYSNPSTADSNITDSFSNTISSSAALPKEASSTITKPVDAPTGAGREGYAESLPVSLAGASRDSAGVSGKRGSSSIWPRSTANDPRNSPTAREGTQEIKLSSNSSEQLMKSDTIQFPITHSSDSFRMNLFVSSLGCQFSSQIWRLRDGEKLFISNLNFPCDNFGYSQYTLDSRFQSGDILVLEWRPNIIVHEEQNVISIPRISLIDNKSNAPTPIYGSRVKW